METSFDIINPRPVLVAPPRIVPSPTFPGEEGWYFNQGARTGLTEEFFTVSHLIETEH